MTAVAAVDIFGTMNAVQAFLLGGGIVALSTVTITVMNRIVRSERASMQRRRQAWIDSGGDPDDGPDFYAGSGTDFSGFS